MSMTSDGLPLGSTATYGVRAEDYLVRAKKCLEEDDPRFLFYAALELRLCVEARQVLYLEAQEAYRKSLPRAWEIGKSFKELRRIYDRDEAQAILVKFDDGEIINLKFIPVSKSLKKKVERFGNFLHHPEESYQLNQICEMRRSLEETLYQAENCMSGNLLAPLMIDINSGTIAGTISMSIEEPLIENYSALFQKGRRMTVKVEYISIRNR